MSDLDKYTPRHVREQRAYRLVVVGSVAGFLGVVGLILAVLGVVGAGIPLVLVILACACAWGFRRLVSR
jgi:hypothetical protein